MFQDFTNTIRSLASLQEALQQSTRSNWFGHQTANRGARPPINVFEQSDNVAVLAEIPGSNKSDFNLEVKGNTLRLSGKRIIEYDAKASAHRLERKSYEFDRTVTVPFEIDAENVQANYNNGILAILLSRSDADKPHTVAIK